MSRKPTVAIVVVKQENGERFYAAYDKQENVLMRLKVYDCGHGAHIAHEEFKKHFNISSSDWASNIARKYGV